MATKGDCTVTAQSGYRFTPRGSSMEMLSVFMPIVGTLVFVPLLATYATKFHLVDLPDVRKRHFEAVPLVGGLAMFAAFLTTCGVGGTFADIHPAFFVGAAMMLTIGAADDRWNLPALPRFAMQALAIWLAVSLSGNVLSDLGQLVSPQMLALGAFAAPFTVFGILGVVNAVNLIDGADGLAGGIAFTALAWFFAAVALLQTDGAVPVRFSDPSNILLALMGAVLGFLCLNMRTPLRARAGVFMGDGGSLFIGFVLGWFAVATTSQFHPDHLSPVSALWILIVPLFDTVACMSRRILSGRSPMRPDRKHVHHLLEACGLSTGQAVSVLIVINALGGLVGVIGWRCGVPEYVLFAAIAGCFVAYVVVSTVAWNRIQKTAPTE